LAFVVIPLKGEVSREVCIMQEKHVGKLKDGSPRIVHELKKEMRKEPAGFMVYFPRGHAIRVRTQEDLRAYGLDRKPNIISMEGLHDPNSAIGRLLMDQDQKGRDGAYADLQQQVIALATRKTGAVLMPEQITKVQHV